MKDSSYQNSSESYFHNNGLQNCTQTGTMLDQISNKAVNDEFLKSKDVKNRLIYILMLKFIRNPIKSIIKYNYRDYIKYASRPCVKSSKKVVAKTLTEVEDKAKLESEVGKDEEVKKKSQQDSVDKPLNDTKHKTLPWRPNCLLDVLKTIEEQVIGVYHKSRVCEQIEHKLDQSWMISKILENLNSLVDKYYIEELKPEHNKFQFKRCHLCIPSLWPVYSRRLLFLLNIGNGFFKNKITELLSHEHLSEIGYNIHIESTMRK